MGGSMAVPGPGLGALAMLVCSVCSGSRHSGPLSWGSHRLGSGSDSAVISAVLSVQLPHMALGFCSRKSQSKLCAGANEMMNTTPLWKADRPGQAVLTA